jgi:hypothetical protein
MRRTHCKHGHELTPDNVYLYTARGKKERNCIVCKRRNALASWHRKRYEKAKANHLAQIVRWL